MYLKSISLKNTGPIQSFDLNLPIQGEMPKPLLLVGKNGTGKSTAISFIVNAILALRQKIYENVEVKQDRVFRLRSPLGINGSEEYYFAKLEFEKNFTVVEWQFNGTKDALKNGHLLSAFDPRWIDIPPKATSDFHITFGELHEQYIHEDELKNTCLLYFPADRFEPPDWLNLNDLAVDLQLPDYSRMAGTTPRRFLSKNRLKPTLEWLTMVIFDVMLNEHEVVEAVVKGSKRFEFVRRGLVGKAGITFQLILLILKNILCDDKDENVRFNIGHRNNRIISVDIMRNGNCVRTIQDLMALSAGESALFCLFSSIIRDADLADQDYASSQDIAGIVIIDEIDLHLHHNLQYKVLPKLIALFPRIQFIVSVHAPAVLLGLANQLGPENIEIREMPKGDLISPERYTEFLDVFNAFSSTQKFEYELLRKINATNSPVLLFEGITDAKFFEIAWSKNFPSASIPYRLIPCGIEPDPSQRGGGAEMLRRCLEFLSVVSDVPVLAIFDNDRIGNEQFNGLKASVFIPGMDKMHKAHVNKPIHAMLLPVPENRQEFVSQTKLIYRYLSVEHYFSDSMIEQYGLKGEPVAPGSTVYEIEGASRLKSRFAEDAINFDKSNFDNFKFAFDRIQKLLAT